MPKAKNKRRTPRTRRKSLLSHFIYIKIEHTGDWYHWEEHPGIEQWGVEASLRSDRLSAPIVIATASLRHVDLGAFTDLYHELDCISADLGDIASAITNSEDRLNEYSIAVGNNSSLLIAEDVVVDRFWRGNHLGPALLFFAADTLRVDGIFLTPVALGTRLDASGVCFTDYEAPRPGPLAQKKVETAWRKAGFRKLLDNVVWIPTYPDCLDDRQNQGELARETFTKVQNLSNEPRAKAWVRRRNRRQTGSAPAKGSRPMRRPWANRKSPLGARQRSGE